jgi:hypothetical protein
MAVSVYKSRRNNFVRTIQHIAAHASGDIRFNLHDSTTFDQTSTRDGETLSFLLCKSTTPSLSKRLAIVDVLLLYNAPSLAWLQCCPGSACPRIYMRPSPTDITFLVHSAELSKISGPCYFVKGTMLKEVESYYQLTYLATPKQLQSTYAL